MDKVSYCYLMIINKIESNVESNGYEFIMSAKNKQKIVDINDIYKAYTVNTMVDGTLMGSQTKEDEQCAIQMMEDIFNS